MELNFMELKPDLLRRNKTYMRDIRTRVIVIVQDIGEHACDFGYRLEQICNYEISHISDDKFLELVTLPSIKFMTTASDGRQTATICYQTKLKKMSWYKKFQKYTKELFGL